MTISRAEFRRLLPLAVGGTAAEAEDGYGGHDGALGWRIHLTDLPPLHLGSFTLERLRVELVFEDATEAPSPGLHAPFPAAVPAGRRLRPSE